MKAKLISLDIHTPGSKIVLDELPVIVGRSPEAHICLQDRWISQCHCKISEIDGTLVVRDLGSTNGTLVNREYVDESSLLPGDRLTVGMTSFEAQYKHRPR